MEYAPRFDHTGRFDGNPFERFGATVCTKCCCRKPVCPAIAAIVARVPRAA